MDILFKHAHEHRAGCFARSKPFDFGIFFQVVISFIELPDDFVLGNFDVHDFLYTADIFYCYLHEVPFRVNVPLRSR